jgi:TPR repeat protein
MKNGMNTKRIILWFLSFMFAFSAGYAQTCYEIGLDDGKKEYAKGETYANSENYAQAIAAFGKAKNRFQSTKENCPNVSVAALDEWTGKCNAAIRRAEQAKADAARRAEQAKADAITLNLSTTDVSFDASGGTATVIVSSNTASWNASNNPAWCFTGKNGNRLTISCQQNTTTNERSGYLYVNAGNKQIKVNLRQGAEDTYATGLQYYEQKKYAEALQWFYKSAEQGNALAQHYLGWMYQNAYGVTKNYGEAVKWYRKSADQGHASAQNNLGYMYQYSYGVEQSYTEAIKWYRKSAEQRSASGQYNLGCMYEYGYGVAKDFGEAAKWYRKSADQGNENAQKALARVVQLTGNIDDDDDEDPYDTGEKYYAEKNYGEAVKWYRKSAEQGNPKGQHDLGWMYKNGYGVEQNYTEAVKWYRKSAEQGHASAQNGLGYMYQYGYGITRDYEEALKWYRKSAAQGYAPAQSNLGYMYYYGYGVTKDYGEALKWYRKSAEQGHASAQYNLGYMYEHGYGVAKDYDEAAKWYRKSADKGNENAKKALIRVTQ